MVCFSIFLPLLKGEMPEGQREFRRKALPRCAGTISRCRGDLPKNSETCPLPNPAPRYPFCCFFRKFVSVIIGFMEKRTRHDLSVMKRLEDWI